MYTQCHSMLPFWNEMFDHRVPAGLAMQTSADHPFGTVTDDTDAKGECKKSRNDWSK